MPFGVVYTIELGDLAGFSTPYPLKSYTAGQAVRELSFTYISSALKISILSNQDNDLVIADVKAQVYEDWSADSDGSDLYLIGEIGNNESITLPEYSQIYIKFPEVDGYKAPEMIHFDFLGGLVEKSVIYQCELLTVNVSADSGSVNGFEVTISKQETVGVATKYTRLEYIESSGTQYINTGFRPSQNTKMCLDVAFLSVVGNNIAGVRNSSSDTINRFGIISFSSATKIGAFFRDSSIQAISYNTSRHSYELSKSGLIVDGTSYGSSNNGTFVCTYPITLGAWNNGEGGISCNNSKIYGCKIYDNGTLVRDYTPALRSDGIAGLYDSVNDTFTASSGSGNFIAGGKQEEIIATQTSATGSYKIPFNTSYTVKASKVNGYTTPASVTRVASAKSYTVTQEYKVITVRDLSLQDIYGNPINRSTANCYVVREAGQYKFPLVYGNAIKNGKVNTAAFTNNGGTNSHDFVDSYGDKIISPYIEINQNIDILNNSCFISYNLDHNDNIISGICTLNEIDCGYIQFNINYIPQQGANVNLYLICDSVPVWTWHIWVWPYDLTPVEITNGTGVKYNILPVNLASKYDNDMIHIMNWYYQWGRSIPMLLPDAWNSTESSGNIMLDFKADYLHSGLCNPETFYYNPRDMSEISSDWNWFGDKNYYNLWDAACTSTGNSDNDTVKTVYDPCPVGWKVPNGNTFTEFFDSIIGTSDGIVKFRRYSGDTIGIEFHLSGFRSPKDGLLNSVGEYGMIWLSSAGSKGMGRLYFTSDYVSPNSISYYIPSYGASIRPVEDDNIQLDVIMISFTIGTTTYQAESGMTWFEWVNSSYNTEGFRISPYGDNYILNSGSWQLVGETYITFDMSVKAVSYRLERYVS